MDISQKLFTRARSKTLLPFAKFRNVINAAQAATRANVGGAVIEVGTFRGGTLFALAEALPEFKVVGFDTLQGLVDCRPADDGEAIRNGDMTAPDSFLESIAQEKRRSPNLHFFKGTFPDVAVENFSRDWGIAFAHVDVDTAHSIQGALFYLSKRMMAGGIIVVDDYGFPQTPGVKPVVDRMVALNQLPPPIVAPCQAIFIFP